MEYLFPINYKLILKPDLNTFRFSGTTEILFEALKPLNEIPLNILDIALWTCKLIQDRELTICPFVVDPKKEKVRIMLPEPISGKFIVEINYEGHINDNMAGFYRSQHMNKYIAVTQFEESEARRAFPCVDHPSKKATFDIEMVIDEGLTAISNTPVKKEVLLNNGKKQIVFAQTPKMSTYLVFFGVGKFEEKKDAHDARMRAMTMPKMSKFARFGLEFSQKSLAFCEAYFGIAYPLAKLDLIAIPDFAFGAMENWGAITFRENLLLYHPEMTSQSGQQRICEVIAHEVAHQWFGNLVTPMDWTFLWLNESFATFFGYGIVDHYYPQWDVWEQFLYSQTGAAFTRDALLETFAIEIPDRAHVVINNSTSPIIYNKGGSILRQIQGYIGKENFKKGLHDYLKTHAYSCAESHHLWEALEKASKKPITRMMKSWIEQPGFPILEVERSGNHLLIKQKRFTYLPNDTQLHWFIPVSLRIFTNKKEFRHQTVLMDTRQKTIELSDNTIAYKVNAEHTGFYRVMYKDPKNIEAISPYIRDKIFSPQDRWGLQNDLYALFRSGETTLEEYLKFLSNYDQEEAFLPLIGISENLHQLYLILKSEKRKKIAQLKKNWIEKILFNIGLEPNPQEKLTTSILRDHFIWHASLIGSKEIIDFARQKFEMLMAGHHINADILRSVMQVGAFTGNTTVFDWFCKRLELSTVEHERMNILMALGSFKEQPQLDKTRQYVLEKVPARNKFVPIASMAANPCAIPHLWYWFISHIDQLEAFHPMIFERIITAIVPIAGIEHAQEVKSFFTTYMRKNDKVRDTIKMSLENLEINVRMRNHAEKIIFTRP